MVLRRSSSALALAACLERDTQVLLVPRRTVLGWGDRLATWFLAERDVRGRVEGRGWAHAVAHGADALGVLACSPHLGREELEVVLEVLADRVARPGCSPDELLLAGEPDRLASAALGVLRGDLVTVDHLEGWLPRLVGPAGALRADADADADGPADPYLTTGNLQASLRALHLQLVLAPGPPAVRSDLLLVLVEALCRTNPQTLGAPARTARS